MGAVMARPGAGGGRPGPGGPTAAADAAPARPAAGLAVALHPADAQAWAAARLRT
jgi:hypothetical protein